MRPAKIVAIVLGALLVLIGLALLVSGVFLLAIYGTQRDSSGFFETSDRVVSTTGHALVTPDVDLNLGPGLADWTPTGGGRGGPLSCGGHPPHSPLPSRRGAPEARLVR